MRKVYIDEKHRQAAYMEWHNETYPGLKIVLPDCSTPSPSPSSAERNSDGRFAVPSTSGESRCAIVLEAKNELGAAGDPHLQGLRYYQVRQPDRMYEGRQIELMSPLLVSVFKSVSQCHEQNPVLL